MEESNTTLFPQTFEVAGIKVPLFFSFFASRPRYWRLVLFTSIHILLKSTKREAPVSL